MDVTPSQEAVVKYQADVTPSQEAVVKYQVDVTPSQEAVVKYFGVVVDDDLSFSDEFDSLRQHPEEDREPKVMQSDGHRHTHLLKTQNKKPMPITITYRACYDRVLLGMTSWGGGSLRIQ